MALIAFCLCFGYIFFIKHEVCVYAEIDEVGLLWMDEWHNMIGGYGGDRMSFSHVLESFGEDIFEYG